MRNLAKFSIIIGLLLESYVSFSQVPTQQNQPDTAKASTDTTVREFEIIRGPSMRSIYVDSVTTLQTIAGGAIVKQGTTLFNADSIVINPTSHIAEAFGNVHINQADSIQTYSQYLKYTGTDKTAYLKTDVRLNDKKSTLFTQELDYNLGTGIGNYHSGGKVINGKTIITSQDGTYYADTKDINFKNNVVVNEPKNHITTDSLLYNMKTQASNYSGNTHIKNKEADIYTTQGTYDFNTGNALFTSRTTVKDSSNRVYIANNMAIDNKSGTAQLEGNALVRDSASGYIVFANQIFLNNKNNSFLATRKPVLIIKQKDDSIYVAADTIYSGFSKEVSNEGFIAKNDSLSRDSAQLSSRLDSSLHKKTIDSLPAHRLKNEQDSSYYQAHLVDSLNRLNEKNFKEKNIQNISITADSSKNLLQRKDSLKTDAIKIPLKENIPEALRPGRKIINSDTAKILETISLPDSSTNILPKKLKNLRRDSLFAKKKDSSGVPDSSRFFLAFHHVRIYNDSLQSVCDSLFFSTKDSVFRLYYSPVIWSGHSQITGDTIFLFTKNKKADRLYAFDKGIIVNKTTQGFYNQISGKTINGYFKNGAIDYMRVRGSQAESIYYAQDNDSAYLGMNRATGDVIDLYFEKDDLKKVLFINDIDGKFYPMRKIPQDQKFLKNFIWLTDRRPKNKLELFE